MAFRNNFVFIIQRTDICYFRLIFAATIFRKKKSPIRLHKLKQKLMEIGKISVLSSDTKS